MIKKTFVEVIARFDVDGNVTPLIVIWEDGTEFKIDKVLDRRRAASLKAGGIGLRYEIQIGNSRTYLWFEDPNWFVERKLCP